LIWAKQVDVRMTIGSWVVSLMGRGWSDFNGLMALASHEESESAEIKRSCKG